MTCWKCTAKIPDGSSVCPICNTVQNQKISFRVRFFRWMLWACPLMCVIANTINLFYVITGAHYSTDATFGDLPRRMAVFAHYPGAYMVDLVFLVLIFAIYGLIVATTFCAQRQKSSAPPMLLVTNIVIFLWSLCYLFFALLFTGMVSPALILTVVLMILHTAWTVFSFTYWYRSYVFVY